MAGPWEKYAQPSQEAASGPWAKYQKVEEPGDFTAAGQPSTGGGAHSSMFVDPYGPPTEEEDRESRVGAFVRRNQYSGAGGTVRAGNDNTLLGYGDDLQAHVAAALGANINPDGTDEGFNYSRPYWDRYRDAKAAYEGLAGDFSERRPGLSTTGEIAGSLAPAVVSLPAATRYAASALTKVGTALRGALVGTGYGVTEGAISGSSEGEGIEERGRNAARGALLGGAMGGVFGAVAPFAGWGAKAAFNKGKEWAKKLDVSAIAEQLGVSPQAARIAKGALINDDLGKALTALGRGGDDAMLAEAGPSTRALLDASSQSGGLALAVTRDRVAPRAAKQGRAFTQVLDDVLGEPGGVKAAAREISHRTSVARSEAYSTAYAQPIDYAGAGRKIENVLERVPPKTLRTAISEANEAMQEAGERNLQILADIADDGSVTFREMPNVRQLDEIKKALGNAGREGVDQFGRPTAAALRANRLAGDLRDAITEAVPAYGRAVKLGGDKIAEDQALALGRDLFSARTTREAVRDAAKGMSAEAKLAVKRGMRESLDQTMSRARSTLADLESGNFDFEEGANAAREAVVAVRNMLNRDSIAKMEAVLGPRETKRIVTELRKVSDVMVLEGALARNSATAIRQSIQGEARDVAQPGLLRRTLGKGGNPLDAAQEITQSIMEIDPASLSEAQRGYFAEIADALTRIKGEQAKTALNVINKAIQGQPINDAQANLVGRVVAGSTGALGYQAGQQILE